MIDFIRKGKNTSDATATSDDIINPKTAYVNNEKITGNIQLQKKILEIGNYNSTNLAFSNTLESFDVQSIQEYTFIIQTFSNKTCKLQVIKNYTNIIEEQIFNIIDIIGTNPGTAPVRNCCISISSIYNGVVDFTVALAISGGDYQHIFFKKFKWSESGFTSYGTCADYEVFKIGYRFPDWLDVIRDNENADVFYLNFPNQRNSLNTFAAGFVKIFWSDDGIGQITELWANGLIARFNEINECKLFQITGNGNYLNYASRLFEINRDNNVLTIVLSEKVFLSHNMKYMFYNKVLYSLDNTQDIATSFNNKQVLLDLSSLNINAYAPIFFSENDDYLIIPGETNLYIYKYNNETYTLDTTLAISSFNNLLIAQDFNTYDFVISDKTAQFLYLYYCLANSTTISGIQYLNENYIKPDSSNTPSQSQVLAGASYIGINGNTLEGTMNNNGDVLVTPTTSQQTKNSGYYNSLIIEAVDSSIDSNIVASNIKSGVTILGIEGTYTGETSDIVEEE